MESISIPYKEDDKDCLSSDKEDDMVCLLTITSGDAQEIDTDFERKRLFLPIRNVRVVSIPFLYSPQALGSDRIAAHYLVSKTSFTATLN